MRDYPQAPVPVNHVEPVPRRVRGFACGELLVDTTRALYVWEWPNYPQWYIPVDDVVDGALVDENQTRTTRQGLARVHGVRFHHIVAALGRGCRKT